MISWYPGLEKLEPDDIEIDYTSSTCKCVGCEHNRDGFCDKKKKWAHLLNNCIVVYAPDTKLEKVNGLVGIFKNTSSYYYKIDKNKKRYRSKPFNTELEAVKALAKLEKRLYGKRQRNLHLEV